MLDLTNTALRYQTATAHDTRARRALERTIAPYRAAGYTVLSDTGYTLRLSAPPEPYPTLEILLWLVVFFPIGIVVLVMRAAYSPPEVTIRYASDNTVEEDGFTLGCLHKVQEQLQRRRYRTRLILLVVALLVGTLIGLQILTNQAR